MEDQFTSNLGTRWTDPITARRVPSKKRETNGEQKGIEKRGSKKQGGCSIIHCNILVYIMNACNA